MNLQEAVETTRQHLERQFPRSCGTCGREYSSLKDYLSRTTHVGKPVSYDVQVGNWWPRIPLGTISCANCKCGSTLVLGSEGMGLTTMWRLMTWARHECSARGVAVPELLEELRRAIDMKVLAADAIVHEEATPEQRLRDWRESVVTFYLTRVTFLVPIAIAVWVAMRPPPRFEPPFGALAVLAAGTALFRLLVPRRWILRAGLAFLLGLSLATPALLGLAAGPPLVMLTTAVIATILYGLRAGAVVVAISAATLVGEGWAISAGLLPAPNAEFTAPGLPANWVRTAIFLAIAAMLLVVSLARLLNKLEAAWLARDAAAKRERQAAVELVQIQQEKQRSDDAARRAQRLEAIGRLAGGIAHDFNNLLLVILSWADLMRDDPRLGEAEGLAEIRLAANQAAQLTRRLLTFAKQETTNPKPVDLHATVATFCTSLRRLLPADIRVEHVGTATPPVLVDEAALGQVLLNLGINAGDAMPRGGTLTLCTAPVEPSDVPASAPDPGAPYVALMVSDTGTGMDEATRQRLFEPFFTTKEEGKGTGLGLATVYGIVRQARGWIQVDSAVGHGTTFTVAFPVARPQLEDAPADPPDSVQTGSQILVVDDDASVRRVMVLALRAAGFAVLEAADVEQGLAVARRFRGEIRLLCSDGVMPGAPTRKLVSGFRELFPGAPVLVCSGHSEQELEQRGTYGEGVEFLPKPFAGVELVSRVKSLLGGSAGQARSLPQA
jgi:signal transduction histidine kinase/CheY-like chemotaxis protein